MPCNQANRLKLSRLDGIHFVDKGAAIEPKVLVIKRTKEKKGMSFAEKFLKALGTAKGQAFAKEMPDLDAMFEETVGALSDEQKAIIMAKLAATAQKPADMPETPAEPEKAADEEQPADRQPAAPAPEEETVKADGPEDAAMKKRYDALSKRLEAAEQELAKRMHDDDLREQTEVAKRFPHVPGDIAKRAELLLGVKKRLGDDSHAELVSQFEAAEKLAKRGLTVAGSSAPTPMGGAAEKLDEIAKRLQSEEGISQAKAYAKARRQNPELRREEIRERQ